MNKSNNSQRVIGLDVHPDSFAGAILTGNTPASARVVSTSRRVELPELEKWAARHTSPEDVLVMEGERQRLWCGGATARTPTPSGDPG